ncbi:hypothetical protein [Sphingobium bisphenolivorans]|uniref:hypothetical protein n=1 Tax=Sphingobium bisphenolivorans TaxID=1335760 RepID=UPI0003B5BA6B|nr:hypothetical protein [Sphingobium bisphenolivorans]
MAKDNRGKQGGDMSKSQGSQKQQHQQGGGRGQQGGGNMDQRKDKDRGQPQQR